MDLVVKMFNFLNENCKYAVLRNYNGLPHQLNSRDIDILIAKKDFKSSKAQIIKIITELNFKITTYFKNDRMFTLVCAQVNDKKNEIIQFDFFFQTSLFGIQIIDANSILESRVYNKNVFHTHKDYEFLDKFMYLKMLNVSYPLKYEGLRKEMSHSLTLNSKINSIVRRASLSDLEAMSSFKFKKQLVLNNLKQKPRLQIIMLCRFFYYYILNFINYKGFSIGFTGPDGSGKTTVINAIVKELKNTYPSIDLFHFRPHFMPNLGEAAQKTRLKVDVDKDYSNPHRGKKTGKLNALIRLVYYSTDYVLGYFLMVRPKLRKRSIVIFDRYFTDIIADGRRSRIHLKSTFLYRFGALFIPKLDYNILLTADKDVILTRKQELSPQGIIAINQKLEYLSHKNQFYFVLNNENPKVAVQNILNHIFEAQHLINMKRLG